MKCANCKHWRKEQAETGYSKYIGFCTTYKMRWTSTNAATANVLDRSNVREKGYTQAFETQNNEPPIGVPGKSRYLLVTGEEYGCVHHEKL